MMPRIAGDCKECSDILSLINAINCVLYEKSLSVYNNIIFGLCKGKENEDLFALLFYKDVLIHKYADRSYACEFSVEQIANRVRMLTANCNQCISDEIVIVYFATTTTSTSTTTTTTTIAPTTTTTTTSAQNTYVYNVTSFICGTCTMGSGFSLSNNIPATIGKYYYSPTEDRVIRIDSLLGVDPGATPPTLNMATESVSCAAVICSATTTTSSTSTTTSTTTLAPTTTTTSTTQQMVIPVLGTCCGGSPITQYIAAGVVLGIGQVIDSVSEGYLGGYVVQGNPEPGTPTIVRYGTGVYNSCAEWSTIWSPVFTCQPVII